MLADISSLPRGDLAGLLDSKRTISPNKVLESLALYIVSKCKSGMVLFQVRGTILFY